MSNFDPSYRPTSEAEARELLNTMPRGHYYALNEGGRLKFLEGNSWDEAMELVADEPTDQEMFDMFHNPGMILEEIASIHVNTNADALEITIDGLTQIIPSDLISEVQDVEEGVFELHFGEHLMLTPDDLDWQVGVSEDQTYSGTLADGRVISIRPQAPVALAA